VKNLVNAEDRDHARMRRIFSHAFSDKALKEQEPLFQKYVDLMAQKLHEKLDADPDAQINMVEMFNFTTFDIMGISLSLLLAIDSLQCMEGLAEGKIIWFQPVHCRWYM
jgi:cytochrome P450